MDVKGGFFHPLKLCRANESYRGANMLAEQIDQFLNEVILRAENQHEILIGSCTSEVSLTNTQEHILMLLAEERLTSSELAKRLNVSQAAVTKATKALIKEGMLDAKKDVEDQRVTYFYLTERAVPIAAEHGHHHAHTLETYAALSKSYSKKEQETIGRFLNELLVAMKEEGKREHV